MHLISQVDRNIEEYNRKWKSHFFLEGLVSAALSSMLFLGSNKTYLKYFRMCQDR